MNHRVLVIDDEPSVRSALERTLRHLGYDVLSAGGPDSAYEILAHDRFDAILLDIRMPFVSGDTLFLAIIRRWPELRDRIVLMSGDPENASVGWSQELKQRPFLSKPFTFDSLTRAIVSVLPGAAARPRISNGPA